jgi:hypothetical protein
MACQDVFLCYSKAVPDDTNRDPIQQSGIPDAPAPPVAEQQITGSDAAQVAKQDMDTKISNLGDELHKAERWMIWLTGAIGFFGLCAVIVGVLQWCAMRGQLAEMKNGGIDTHTLAETSKLTLRPRVAIVSVGPYQEMVNSQINNHLEGGFLRVQVGYTNKGTFAARNVRIFTYDSIGPNASKGSYQGEPQQFPQIQPTGEQVPNTYLTGKTQYSLAELDGLIKGRLRATFSVLIVYDDDIGKETHHAEYCDVFTLQPYNDICPWPVQNN